MNKQARIMIIMIIFTAAVLYVFGHIGFNVSDSVNFTFYWHSAPAASPVRGRYYALKTDLASEYSGMITKRMVCLPNDIISREGMVFFCNGEEIGKIEITHSYAGNAFPQYSPPAGGLRLQDEIFVLGDSATSYDSRYFGLLPVSSIFRELTPLW